MVRIKSRTNHAPTIAPQALSRQSRRILMVDHTGGEHMHQACSERRFLSRGLKSQYSTMRRKIATGSTRTDRHTSRLSAQGILVTGGIRRAPNLGWESAVIQETRQNRLLGTSTFPLLL